MINAVKPSVSFAGDHVLLKSGTILRKDDISAVNKHYRDGQETGRWNILTNRIAGAGEGCNSYSNIITTISDDDYKDLVQKLDLKA